MHLGLSIIADALIDSGPGEIPALRKFGAGLQQKATADPSSLRSSG
jgi:hypothetical protein